ncbi:MAG: Spx/MgsR family RNA polymerase-binding regulatory protein [Xanthomonadales bacterium]|nr:Spx/MgsR family RNA polymerase-binding regulatory protein [Xanthomonadales bacterium]
MVTVYGLSNCSTCHKALAWLDGQGIAHRFIDYRETPVPEPVLRRQAEAIGWEKLVNRASYTWRGLEQARKTPADDSQWLALVGEYPALIRRPLLVRADGSAVSGFSEKRWSETFERQVSGR